LNFSVPRSCTRLRTHRGTGIVEYDWSAGHCRRQSRGWQLRGPDPPGASVNAAVEEVGYSPISSSGVRRQVDFGQPVTMQIRVRISDTMPQLGVTTARCRTLPSASRMSTRLISSIRYVSIRGFTLASATSFRIAMRSAGSLCAEPIMDVCLKSI